MKKKRRFNTFSQDYEEFVESSCKSKNRYDNEYEAKVVADWVKENNRKILHCYYCNICNGYHLTESSKDYGNKIF